MKNPASRLIKITNDSLTVAVRAWSPDTMDLTFIPAFTVMIQKDKTITVNVSDHLQNAREDVELDYSMDPKKLISELLSGLARNFDAKTTDMHIFVTLFLENENFAPTMLKKNQTEFLFEKDGSGITLQFEKTPLDNSPENLTTMKKT